jgi:broad specificity phosphatase PhoE
MASVFFVTHPEVTIDPAIPVPQWPLSARGRARMAACVGRAWTRGIVRIVASQERKAIDAAMILADGLGLGFSTLAGLGENDRSATGYLPRAEFERMADAFFAHPAHSVRGWERALDAQRRIVAAFETVLALAPPGRDVAIISHGAVGTLLLCHLEGIAISRAEEQPSRPGDPAGGYYYRIDRSTRLLRHGWLPIEGE